MIFTKLVGTLDEIRFFYIDELWQKQNLTFTVMYAYFLRVFFLFVITLSSLVWKFTAVSLASVQLLRNARPTHYFFFFRFCEQSIYHCLVVVFLRCLKNWRKHSARSVWIKLRKKTKVSTKREIDVQNDGRCKIKENYPFAERNVILTMLSKNIIPEHAWR